MLKKTFYKKDLVLKEEAEKNYAASTTSTTSSPSELVSKAKSEHSDADAVTIDGSEIDGNSSTQTATIEVNDTPQELQNAQKMARTLHSQGQDANFKVNLHNSKKIEGNRLTEGVTFSKIELSKFLKKI